MLDEPLRIKHAETPAWPAEVDLILSAMEVVQDKETERREFSRRQYRVRAELKLFSDLPGTKPWILYTRDVNPRGVGFISAHRLPLGYGGWVELQSPAGRKMRIHCTLFRCRQSVQGWYEGALYFNREQHAFEMNG